MIKTNIDYGYFNESVIRIKQTNTPLRINANDNKIINVFLCDSCGNRDWQIGSNYMCFCSECNRSVSLAEIYEAGK